ncbi:MAG: hypothetical protein WDM81_11335 [Rhizomicrobium sp.]
MASAPTTSAPTSTIVPGSAEDLRVNVGDTVHFAYNQYNIEDSDKGTLQRQATWLQRISERARHGRRRLRRARHARIQSRARRPARPTRVKEYLVSLGVSSARVDTISYGKEHPVCSESTEDCWAQNRRGVTSGDQRREFVSGPRSNGIAKAPGRLSFSLTSPLWEVEKSRSAAKRFFGWGTVLDARHRPPPEIHSLRS